MAVARRRLAPISSDDVVSSILRRVDEPTKSSSGMIASLQSPPPWASEFRPLWWDLLHEFCRAAFPTSSSERFKCADDNIFGYQFRGLKIREEQACSHRIQYADKLLG